MKKNCLVCGKESYLMSWETECFSCKNKKYNNKISQQIKDGEIDSVDCEDEIFCPYCGEINEVNDNYEIYEDGEHDFTCCDCEKEFTVTTNISYSFDTKRRL